MSFGTQSFALSRSWDVAKQVKSEKRYACAHNPYVGPHVAVYVHYCQAREQDEYR